MSSISPESRLRALELANPVGYRAARLLLAEAVGWLESGAHETFEADPTVAQLAWTIASDVASSGPGECGGRSCPAFGSGDCALCAYNPRAARDARFAESCRAAVERYRDRQAQSAPV